VYLQIINTEADTFKARTNPLPMAKLTPTGLSGAIGPVVFYQSEGQQHVKSKPRKVNQTPATKASANKFAQAATASRIIREGLYPILMPFCSNRQMRNTLTTAVFEWLPGAPANTDGSYISVPSISGLELNPVVSLKKIFKKSLHADWSQAGKVIVTIPSLDPREHIKVPLYTTSIELIIVVSSCMIGNSNISSRRNISVKIPYKSGLVFEQQVELQVARLSNSLNVVAAGLRYNVGSFNDPMLNTDLKWMPASIVDAAYMAHSVQ
jgi:hypothetical protein